MAKVLVIDDEAMIRWPIQQMLGTAGHEVCVAETAAEGFTVLRQQRPDVVFLDVRLPDADGLTVLRRIREECGPRPAVILMTAFDGWGANRAEALRLGACDYLTKPFDFDGLEAIVRKALEGQAAGDGRGH